MNLMDFEPDYKREKGNGSATEHVFGVEARYNYIEPIQVNTRLFDQRWKTVHFEEGVVGVPLNQRDMAIAKSKGYLPYAAAQALRWWLHAEVEALTYSGLCFETRLVQHRIESSYSIKAVSIHGHIHGEDRSNLIPDWGTKEQSK